MSLDSQDLLAVRQHCCHDAKIAFLSTSKYDNSWLQKTNIIAVKTFNIEASKSEHQKPVSDIKVGTSILYMQSIGKSHNTTSV